MDFIDRFFQIQGFMPHGMCLLWRPGILWTMVLGNGVIALSYFMIPVALIYLILKRKDMGFKWIFVLFGAFILACGFTHVMSIVTLWYPLYGLEALILAFTGAVSFITAILLWPLLPVLLKIPSPWQLEKLNGELKKSNAELERIEYVQSKWASIVEFTDDAIISKSLEGVITSWNEGAEHLYGYHANEVIGKSILLIFLPDRLNEFREAEQQIRQGKGVRYLETERKHKDGHVIPISVTISPLKDKLGNVIGACSISRDITEWKKIQNMKNEFISVVSHELRTPLTSIQGSLSLLVAGVGGILPEKAQKLLQIGKQNSERLIRLINDILDVAKIESGKMELNITPCDIGRLVNEAIIANQSYAEQFGISVQLHEQARGTVNADHDRLVQVITNLLSNAIKFSIPAGIVAVNINEHDNKIIVSVTNTGEAIPEEFQASIFNKFAQANTNSARKQTGTGLGLSISKDIIERLDGYIGFRLNKNKQTTFFFELPLVTNSPTQKLFFDKIPVLLICHEMEIAQELKEFLEKNEYKVIITHTGQDALTILNKNHIDALMINLALPDVDGISFLKKLRVQYTAAQLPIIATSLTNEKNSDTLNGSAISIVDWMDKPINLERVLNNIQLIKNYVKEKSPNILLIEDEVDLLEVIANLAQEEANVIGTTTLKAAKATLDEQRFDLVILDLSLPDGSGIQLLPELSKKNIPIIVFSAFELPEDFGHYTYKTLLKSKTSLYELLEIIKSSLLNKKLD
ncbi:MAG: response regulator [Gammaproteobacteria bacterium]|nr:response regulator [Gammaproteobacteria bacterium]